MKTVKLNHRVEIQVYTSIDEMPIVNFQKYNKYLLLDSGLGSDVDSVDAHIIKIAKYITNKDSANAIQELQNMRQNLHLIVSELSPKYMAFAAAIYSINGKVITDLSDEGLKAILEQLRSVKHSKLIEVLEWLKKKVSDELEAYFPGDFTNVKEKEAYDKLKQKLILQTDDLINDTDSSEKIDEIDAFLFSLHKPSVFIGKDSVEIKYDKQFESACMLIGQKANLNAKKMTVLQFYNTLNDIKKQAEAEAKAYKKYK